MSIFDGRLYSKWRTRRYNAIVAHYGNSFFSGKTFLEVGAGNGDFGRMFYDLGSIVTCFEGRDQNFSELKLKHPELKSRKVNLDIEFVNEKFDIIFHCGVLYHLINFEANLRSCLRNCDHLILETEVVDFDSLGYWVEMEDVANPGASLGGLGTRATCAYIEYILKTEGFIWSKPDRASDINTNPWIYDWTPSNSGLIPGLRAMWFCKRSA